jgi:presequence protease
VTLVLFVYLDPPAVSDDKCVVVSLWKYFYAMVDAFMYALTALTMHRFKTSVSLVLVVFFLIILLVYIILLTHLMLSQGDDDVYDRLELMDTYMREFEINDNVLEDSKIEWQPKSFKEPKKEIYYYPIGEGQPETYTVQMNWLLNDKHLSVLERWTWRVLDTLFVNSPSSVLLKALIESGLGSDIVGYGLVDYLLQFTYKIGLTGVEEADVEKVEQLILDTLEQVVRDGLSKDEMDSAVNTVEFLYREYNTGSFPVGLSVMDDASYEWVYGNSPTEVLKFTEPLQQLRETIKASGSKVFQDMVAEMMLNNTHRTTVLFAPSKTMEQDLLNDEETRLAEYKASLSDAELDDLVKETKAFNELQTAGDSPEDLATIPHLELSDLDRTGIEYPIDVTQDEEGSGVTVVRHELGSTPGIVYCTLMVDTSRLALDDVPLLPLLTQMIVQTGTSDMSPEKLANQIGLYTGGITASLLNTAVNKDGHNESMATSGEYMITKLKVDGKALGSQVNKLLELMQAVLVDANLDDNATAIEVLRGAKSTLESEIQETGVFAANKRMQGRSLVDGYIVEITEGITYLNEIDKLLDQADKDWPALLDRLETIRETLLDEDYVRSGMILDFTGDQHVLESIKPSVSKFLKSFPGKANGSMLPDPYNNFHPWTAEAKARMAETLPVRDEGFVVSTQVNFVGKGGLLYHEEEYVPGSAAVVTRYLEGDYLWNKIRIVGGAYGAISFFYPFSGFVSFLSYLDPNLVETINVYDAMADDLMSIADELEDDPAPIIKAVIGTVGILDGLLSTDQKGAKQTLRWLMNQSADYRQRYRGEVLNTQPSDFRDFAARLKKMKDARLAVVSSEASFKAAAKAGVNMTLIDIFE